METSRQPTASRVRLECLGMDEKVGVMKIVPELHRGPTVHSSATNSVASLLGGAVRLQPQSRLRWILGSADRTSG